MSKVSAVSQQLSLVAEFQLKECAGEEKLVQHRPYRTPSKVHSKCELYLD